MNTFLTMIRFEAILRVTYNYQNYLQTLGR